MFNNVLNSIFNEDESGIALSKREIKRDKVEMFGGSNSFCRCDCVL